jgi:hypothetical protein
MLPILFNEADPCRIFYRIEGKKEYILYVMRGERELRNFIPGDMDNEISLQNTVVGTLARISHHLSSRGGERWYLTYLYSGHPALHPLG